MSAQDGKMEDEILETIQPPRTMRHLVSGKKSGSGPAIDLDAIERADQAMEKLSVSFNIWIEEEVEKLREAHQETIVSGMEGDAREALFRSAHDLRGEARTLGYPLLGQAAGTLADLLSMMPEEAEIPPALVEGHVQAIHAMLREDAKGEDNKIAIELVNCLREAANQLLEANGAFDDPDEEDGQVSAA
ncbi:Hpt domain-containing protein [Tepidamorphus sp. 3E244]|uniref:Hpt domain-containing protein n=1 Tax=Tepidamorphus sp. 3E244 TaxID=3385498 RepID=UPI0038FD2EFC